MQPRADSNTPPGSMHTLALDQLAAALHVPARFTVDPLLENYLRLMGVMPALPLATASAKASADAKTGAGFDAVLARLVAAYGTTDIDVMCQAIGRSRHTVRVWKGRGFIPNEILLKACVQRGVQLTWLINGDQP